MRGRTIYYQNRRILVFCGEKRKMPHSVNDEFATTAETATIGENAEARTTETSESAESESGGAIGSADDPLITSSELTEAASGISTLQTANAVVYRHVMGSVSGGVAIVNESKALHSGSKLALPKGDMILGNETKAIPSTSLFSETDEGIASGNESEAIKTAQNEKAEAESGISSIQEIGAKTTGTAKISEAASGISTLQDVEGYVEQPTVDIPSGVYNPRNDISNYEAFRLEIPFSYINDIDQLVYANSIETKYVYVMQAWGWQIYFDDTPVGLSLGSYFWGCPSITVLQTTAATIEQFAIFNRYFQRITTS